MKKPQYTLSSQYVGVNNYLNTLSKKFPDEKSVKGKEATLVKSVSRLSLKILQYRWMIMEAEEWMEDGDYYYESSVPELFLSGCLPSDVGRYLCLENPREYFRLAGMAQNYIIKQSKKVKDLRIKSTTVEIKPGDNPRTGWGRDYIVTINLKEPLNQKHVLKEYENYNPYTYDGSGLPSTGTWKNKEEIWYVGQLYRITASGRERQVNELVFIKGKYGSKVLKSDIRMKKAATYKLYFSEYEDSSNPRKYCVTFKLDESML